MANTAIKSAISIQPLLRFIEVILNIDDIGKNFNTTLVKVHPIILYVKPIYLQNFNTTLVKVHLKVLKPPATLLIFQYNPC